MFIEAIEMESVISYYQVNQITNNDETILQSCIIAAIKRVSSYLGIRYDVSKIFTAVGEDRDPDILEITKNVALWFLLRKNNVDFLYERVKETYDRDIKYLTAISKGELAASLPLKEGAVIKPIMGSNQKFTHSF